MPPLTLTYRIAGRRVSFSYFSLISFVTCFLIAGCVGNSIPTEGDQSYNNTLSFTDPDKMRMVDCMLPGRVHRLGNQAAFISPRRPQKLAAGLCEIRGGEYVAYDRADLETSLRVWLVEAEMGNASAQTYVGEIFEQGLGTTPNHKRAVEWYRKAAGQGFARAQMNLGYLYEKGLGVPEDKVAALTWYRKATGLSQDELQLASQSAPLKTELAESQKHSEELKRRLTKMEGQLTARMRELENTRKKIVEQKKVIVKPESDIGQQKTKLTELKEGLDEREQVLEERQLQFAGEQDQLLQRTDQAERAHETIKFELQAAKDREVELQAQLAKQEDAAVDLQRQLNDLQQKLLLKQKDLENAQVDLNEILADLEQRSQQPDVAENDKELSRLRELVSEREIQVDKMHEAFGNLNKRLELTQREAVKKQQQLELYVSKTGELDKREKVLEERQLQLTGEQDQLLQRTGQAERAHEAIKIELQAARDREVALEVQLAKQENAAADLQRQLNDLQQKLQLKENDLDNAEVDLKEIRADLEQRAQQPYIAENEKELSRLKELLYEREIQVNKMHEAFGKFSTETALERIALMRRLESVKGEEAGVRDLVNQHMLESADYQKRLRETEKELQTAHADFKRQSEKFGNLSEQLELTQREAVEKQQQLELHVSTTGNLKSEHSRETEKLTAEIENLKKTIDELKVEVARNVKQEEPPIPGDLFALEEFGDYYALIISNSGYTQLDSLPTAQEDAKAVSRILKEDYGFSTKVLSDANLGDVLVALLHLKEKLKENDKLLIYYTGHGYLDKEGNGWWQLVDAAGNNKEKKNWLDDKEIAAQLDSIKARHILIVADSCYSTQWTAHSDLQVDKPPEKYGDRNILKKWVRRMLKIETRMVLTSGQLRPIALSKESKNSIFTTAFLDTLQKKRPVLEGSRLAYEIYQSVGTAGNNLGLKGAPTYDSIRPSVHRGGEFFFRRTQSLHADVKPSVLPGEMPLAMK